MACEHASRAELSGYADDELSETRRQWWREHLAACASCREALGGIQSLRASLRTHLPPREPSSALRDDIRTLIQAERRGPVSPRATWAGWRLAAAAVLLLAMGAGLGRLGTGGRHGAIVDDVVAGHLRSLAVDHLVDVASSEHHVVKPWFAGKLDFSPPVPDLAEAGFPLVGARVDYLDGHPVAALVYARGPHRINLLLWPDRKSSDCGREPLVVRQGFNLAHGWAAGMEFWAISDLNAGELGEFVRQWQREAAPGDHACA